MVPTYLCVYQTRVAEAAARHRSLPCMFAHGRGAVRHPVRVRAVVQVEHAKLYVRIFRPDLLEKLAGHCGSVQLHILQIGMAAVRRRKRRNRRQGKKGEEKGRKGKKREEKRTDGKERAEWRRQ